jgi:hypothetical protein
MIQCSLAVAGYSVELMCPCALPAAAALQVNMWQVLNLLRIVSCGLAWAVVCYRWAGEPWLWIAHRLALCQLAVGLLVATGCYPRMLAFVAWMQLRLSSF